MMILDIFSKAVRCNNFSANKFSMLNSFIYHEFQCCYFQKTAKKTLYPVHIVFIILVSLFMDIRVL